MIQRVQSLILFFSAIFSITIVYNFPILNDATTGYFLKDNYLYPRLCVFTSAGLSFLAVFQFRKRKLQHLIVSLSRLMLTFAFFLIIILHLEEKSFGIGTILLIIPFVSLLVANYFIKRDEKLVNSADRIR